WRPKALIDLSREEFKRIRTQLQARSLIGVNNDLVWKRIQCPLYPQKRTLELSPAMSALCQNRTSLNLPAAPTAASNAPQKFGLRRIKSHKQRERCLCDPCAATLPVTACAMRNPAGAVRARLAFQE